MPRVVRTVAEWRALRTDRLVHGHSIGFVPTMGALHAGHASLFAAARRENAFVLASVFVNPTQFDESGDFEKYPKTWDSDCVLMDSERVDAVFAPDADEMYPDKMAYAIEERRFSAELCGAHRPGHFSGVLTVVMKLLQIAGAQRAYFGEKDYQQLELVRGMCRAFFLETEIVRCPTVREPDGLAMSSRNARLSAADRALAPQFHAALASDATAAAAQERLERAGFGVDYVLDRDGRRFGAVRLGPVRLIDNVAR